MKVITFGEIMLRLAPHGYYRFTQANDFEDVYKRQVPSAAVAKQILDDLIEANKAYWPELKQAKKK